MKKKKVGMLFLFAAFMFTACEKEQQAEVLIENDNTSTIRAFQETTTSFISQELRTENSFERKPKWWQKLMKVVGADLTGGLGGALIGSSVPGLGTGVGAIIGGAGASLTAGSSLSAPPNGGGAGNPANAYDYIGEEHVNILFAGLTDGREEIFDGDELNAENYHNYAKNWLIENDIFTVEQVEGYTVDNLLTNLGQANEHSGLLMTEVISSFEDLGLIDGEEKEILHDYYSAFEASSSYDSFFSYSIEAESIIIESDFSDTKKELFLSTMATTRHDLNYWKDL